jgi:hypothetical protein
VFQNSFGIEKYIDDFWFEQCPEMYSVASYNDKMVTLFKNLIKDGEQAREVLKDCEHDTKCALENVNLMLKTEAENKTLQKSRS